MNNDDIENIENEQLKAALHCLENEHLSKEFHDALLSLSIQAVHDANSSQHRTVKDLLFNFFSGKKRWYWMASEIILVAVVYVCFFTYPTQDDIAATDLISEFSLATL